MLGQVDSQRLVLSLDGNDQIGQTFASLFLDILIRMFLDDAAKQINGFLDVRIIEFLELFDEDIEHGDGDLSLFRFVSVDVLILLLLFLLPLYGVGHYCDFFPDHVLNQREQPWQNVLQVRSQFFAVDQAEALPACQDVGLLGVGLLELGTLQLDHQLDKR